MNNYDPSALRLEYRRTQSGDVRMRAIRSAIAAAEQVNDYENLIHFHHDLIHESVFSGDRYQALIDFPQFLAATEHSPELKQQWLWDTLWIYKWILEAATEFWQIEKKQILRWFSDYKSALIRNGYSLRTWYEKRAIFYSYCDRAKMRLDFEDFMRAPKDAIGDGTACELDSMVRFYLEIGEREKAIEKAEIIFEKQYRTEEIPCKTYLFLLRDAMQRGLKEEAAQYAKKLRPLCSGDRFQLEPTGVLLRYDAQTNPEIGLQLYEHNLPLRESSRNPFLCFWFDSGAARLLKAAAEAGLSYPLNGTQTDAAGLQALSDSALENSRAIAEKFDARNRSDCFMSSLQEPDMLR